MGLDILTMNNIFPYLLPILLGAVTLILFMGLRNMMRGGTASMSQKLMRWRVLLQFITIVIVMTVLYFSTKS